MSQILANFINPPKGYGEVSFFWWLGDKLTKERLTWQLEKLDKKYIEGLQINYAHSDKGGNTWGLSMKSDPPLFTEEWWELFSWFMQEAKKRGMAVSLSDYTLCTPGQGFFSDEVIKNNPGIEGSILVHDKKVIKEGEKYILSPSANANANENANANANSNTNANKNRIKSENKIYFIHRRVNTKDVYMIYGVPKGEICSFRAKGNIELWNPWTGETCGLTALKVTEQGTALKMPLEENELQIIVFDNENTSAANTAKLFKETKKIGEMPIEGKWSFELKPTMDNRFGDFRLPSFQGFIGAEIRRLEHSLDGENWNEVSCGYGPRFMKIGPLQDTEEIIEFEKGIIEEKYISEHEKYKVNDKLHNFKRYEYYDRMCIEGDPGHQGYHGLKGEMSDEFLFTGKPNFTMTSTEYLPEDDGNIYYFWSTVHSPIEQEVSTAISDFSPVKVWINGLYTAGNKATLRKGTNRILLKYKGTGRGYFIFETEAAPDAWEQSYPLSMTWHNKPGVLGYDILPNGNDVLGRYRFTSAPALQELTITAYGKTEVLVDGTAPKLLSATNLENGSVDYRFSVQSMNNKCSNVELFIIHEKGCYGGAAIPEPIKMNCGEGLIELGDWSKLQGLYSYSGGAYYRKSFNLTKERLKTKVILDLGEVVSTVELKVNGNFVGIKVAPAWKFDITDFVVEGENNIEALVYNTIGNHYTSIPTRYRGEIKSGLIGPVMFSFEEVII